MQPIDSSTQGSTRMPPRLPHSFNFFIHLSREIGTVATRSSISVGQTAMDENTVISRAERRFKEIMPRLISNSDRQNGADALSEATKRRDLKKIASQSHEMLMTANTVFPITLFPNTITVDRTKVTIMRRDFFWSSDVLSIRIEDVLNVQVSVGPLFGSLTVASRVMSTVDHFRISHLWRSDAIKLKHIIQGYVIAQHNKIDTSHLGRRELVDTLIELGQDSNIK